MWIINSSSKHTIILSYLGFSCGSAGKESTCNEGDLGLILELGRSPGEGKGYPLQYSDLENSMDCIDCGVAKSQTQLNDISYSFPKLGSTVMILSDILVAMEVTNVQHATPSLI